MTPEDWARIRDLFEKAIAEGGDDPRAWIAAQSGLDERTRREVLALLDHDVLAGEFLERPAEFEDDPPLEPGHTVGAYRIVREAGRGGAGRVYVAHDSRLGRSVALKALRTGYGRPEQRTRLRREAQAAAALSHPGICTVYALEENDDDVFIVSELIEGRTLRQEIGGNSRPTPQDLMRSAVALSEALACAHHAGIVHGDLKPENVMRTYDGRLKILDFGLARAAATFDSETSKAEAVAGTPGYMAPEILNGQHGDTRADIFALGAMMYELATGEHPFKASDALESADRVLHADPTPVGKKRPDIGEPLAAAIDRCLRKAASERFASAIEIVKALSNPEQQARTDTAVRWWRVHQLIVMVLYAAAAAASWRVKEWQRDVSPSARSAFLVIGVAVTIAVIFRGHLLFTERIHGVRAAGERRRAAPATLAMDSIITAALALDAWLTAGTTSVAAVLIAALAVGLMLARLLLEPSTTRAAFPD